MIAWHLPEIYGKQGGTTRRAARAAPGGAIRETLGHDPGAPLVSEVAEGHPAGVLIRASRHAFW